VRPLDLVINEAVGVAMSMTMIMTVGGTGFGVIMVLVVVMVVFPGSVFMIGLHRCRMPQCQTEMAVPAMVRVPVDSPAVAVEFWVSDGASHGLKRSDAGDRELRPFGKMG
jgi:hypothetical protein